MDMNDVAANTDGRFSDRTIELMQKAVMAFDLYIQNDMEAIKAKQKARVTDCE